MTGPVRATTTAPSSRQDDEVLRELRRAEDHFGSGGGFVGAHYFVHRWKGHDIPDAPELRRHSIQRLVTDNRVELYAVDGKTAIRTVIQPFGEDDSVDDDDTQLMSLPDDEQTVEMKLPEEFRSQVMRPQKKK